MKNLIRNIQNTAHRHSLWEKGDGFVIGVSGGPDSTCLLDIIHSLAPKYGLSIHVVHINYGLRGKDSRDDEDFVVDLCSKRNIPCTVERIGDIGLNPSENTLRILRYDIFERTRSSLGYRHIAVGHTLDDQAETLLFRLIRGTGLNGLGAMRHKNGFVIRPLLDTRRTDILDYLEQKKIPFRIDTSNLENQYARNKIRNTILPLLRTMNPDVDERLASTAAVAATDYDFIRNTALAQIDLNRISPLEYRFSSKRYVLAHPALRNAFLCEIQRRIANETHLRSNTISLLDGFISSRKNKLAQIELGSLKFVKRGDTVAMIISREPSPGSSLSEELPEPDRT